MEPEILLLEAKKCLEYLVLSLDEETHLGIIELKELVVTEQFPENYFEVMRFEERNHEPPETQLVRREYLSVVGCIVNLYKVHTIDALRKVSLNVEPPVVYLFQIYLRISHIHGLINALLRLFIRRVVASDLLLLSRNLEGLVVILLLCLLLRGSLTTVLALAAGVGLLAILFDVLEFFEFDLVVGLLHFVEFEGVGMGHPVLLILSILVSLRTLPKHAQPRAQIDCWQL